MATAIDVSQKYTYADYLTWPDEERWEIIDGIPYNMSAAPSRRHQDILTILVTHFHTFLKGKACKVYAAPFDIRLAEDYSDDHLIENVVQADLSVFCNRSKLDDKGAVGAPDLVVEILSPSTSTKDLKSKLLLYQRFAVKEYWVVDPVAEWVDVLVLDKEGRYIPGKQVSGDEIASSTLFPGLQIPCSDIFAQD